VALENIAIIEREQLVARAEQMGERLRHRLRTLESHEHVGHVRGQGLIAAVEVVADKRTKASFSPELTISQRLTDAMLDRGLCTRVAMDCICLAPPLTIEETLIDRIVEIVGEAITAVTREVMVR
jgi:4-aminobutyrate--pyruvate transaminase